MPSGTEAIALDTPATASDRRSRRFGRIDTAQSAPETVIVAGDEASLYLQATTMRVWHPCGQTPVIHVSPNRDSTHFYGALNVQTGQETVMRSPTMNGATTVLFLLMLLAAYPTQPI